MVAGQTLLDEKRLVFSQLARSTPLLTHHLLTTTRGRALRHVDDVQVTGARSSLGRPAGEKRARERDLRGSKNE